VKFKHGLGQVPADRQTDPQTYKQADHSTSHPFQGRNNYDNVYWQVIQKIK